MFDLTLFRKPTFGGACIAAFALSASMFSMFLYLTLYLQNGLGLSPLRGRRALPAALAAVLPRRAARGADVGAGADPRAHRGRHGSSSPSPCCSCAGCRPPRSGPRCCPASSSPASASRSSTRRWPRPRSAWSRRSARAWARASTRPSARSASPPARRRSARSSSTSWSTTRRARSRACPPRSSPRAARPCPGPVAHKAYLALFTDGLNDILLVAAIVAFAGAVLSFVLIRGSDFVPASRAPRARGRARADGRRLGAARRRVGAAQRPLRAIARGVATLIGPMRRLIAAFPALPRCCSPLPRAPS